MTTRIPRRGLVLRALWWRRGLSAAVLLVAVVTTTAAALGPLYGRAAGESILQDHLNEAGSSAGLHLHTELDIGSSGAYSQAAAAVPRSGAIHGYDRQIRGLYTPMGEGARAAGGQTSVDTVLVWRDGACQHLVITQGHCPSAPNEVIASQRTVDSPFYGFKLGRRVALSPHTTVDAVAPRPPAVVVVGAYRAMDTSDPFWFGQPYFDAGIGSGEAPNTVDALFVAQSEFLSFKPTTVVEADFDYPLTPGALRLRNLGAQRAAVSRLLAAYPDTDSITASSGLLGVLESAARERHVAAVSTLLVTWQLALLAWLVLFQIVSDAIEARGNETAIAKLRGLSPARTVRFGLAEPVFLLALAVPFGLLMALGLTHLFAASVLVTDVPVVLAPSAVGTSLVAFAGGLIAAGLAGYRTFTRSVLDQWRRTSHSPGRGRLALAVDVLVAAAAVIGLVLLQAGHGAASANNTAGLLAPGLLVTAVGVLGLRLLPLLCRWLARLTRASGHLAVFLAARQVSRRPVGLRLAALLAVAIGLATFAVAGETVATANRTARAEAELGASRVATVQFDAGVDPVAAAALADPHRNWAMAAATWLPDGGGSVVGTVLGIDPSRLAAVGYQAAGAPPTAEIARTVGAATVPPITIKAPELRVHVTASGLTGDRHPYLEVNLRTPHTAFYNVDSGTIGDGAQGYALPLACAEGCTLLGVTWNRPIVARGPQSGTITLTGIDVGDGVHWTALDLGLRVPGSWRAAKPAGHASDHVRVGMAGVVDHFANDNGGYGGIVYASAPVSIPAIATPQGVVTGSGPPADLPMLDSTATTAYFRIARYAPVLPGVLDKGLVMDVRFLMTQLPGFATDARWQVWIGPTAPADALTRLDAAGLHVESVLSVQTRLGQLGRQGPALALLLLLVCAVAGAVLAVGGTAISISASSRRRSYEIAALRAVGVSRRSLLRASTAEQLLLLGAAAVLAVPTGLLAARLAMPAIPEFADTAPITLHYGPQWIPSLLFAGALVVLLALTAVIAARALIHIAVPSRLREADQ